MLPSRKRPSRGEHENVNIVVDRERSIHFWKSKVVTNTQSKTQTGHGQTGKLMTRRKAFVLLDRSGGEEMGLSVFRGDGAIRIDEDLRIINVGTIPFRDTANDSERKRLRDFLEFGNRAFSPRCGVSLNHRHRIPGISHFGKDYQASLGILSARRKIANFAKVRVEVTKCAGNLGDRYLHGLPSLSHSFRKGASSLLRFQSPSRDREAFACTMCNPTSRATNTVR